MNKQIGFTLIELMITLSIAAIIVTVAVPGFSDLIRNNRMATNVNEFVTALNYARSEAIKRGRNVIICSSSNQTACGGNWNQGWIIFVDSDNSNNLTLGTGEELRVHEALPGDNLTLNGAASVASTITFTNQGFTNLAAPTEFALCDSRGTSKGKKLELSTTGRLSTSSTAPTTCSP